jgi:hypothetical protein
VERFVVQYKANCMRLKVDAREPVLRIIRSSINEPSTGYVSHIRHFNREVDCEHYHSAEIDLNLNELKRLFLLFQSMLSNVILSHLVELESQKKKSKLFALPLHQIPFCTTLYPLRTIT